MKVTDGQIELELTQEKSLVNIELLAGQYHITDASSYPDFLKSTAFLLTGKIEALSEERLSLSYSLPEFARSLAETVSNLGALERLEMARKFAVLEALEEEGNLPYLHPENLFVLAGELVIAHRGAPLLLQPFERDKTSFLAQYKALVVSTVQPKYKYESLVAGNITTRDPFSKEIFEAENLETIDQIIERQYQVLSRTQQEKKRLVGRSAHSFFKWGLISVAVLALGLGIWIYVSQGITLPAQNRIITAQNDFIMSNYDNTTAALSNDQPKALPKSAQYILAVSYVHLDNLTLEQKNAILNNLSEDSSTNELLYWIYIGRGDFNTALSVAQNIGDNQLILHAYTKLYDATQANTTMDGKTKQDDLSQYMDQITKLQKTLGIPVTPTPSSSSTGGVNAK